MSPIESIVANLDCDEKYEFWDIHYTNRLKQAINGEIRVRFCIFDSEKDLTDKLDEVAITRTVRFLLNPKSGRYSDYKTNPTWLDVTIAANEMLIICNFEDRVFLEDITVTNDIIRFEMGS